MVTGRWERWAPLAGAAAVICWVIAFIIASDTPDTGDDDAKIVSFYAHGGHQNRDIVGYFVFFAGILLFVAFLAALRERLFVAEGSPGRLSALAFGAGIASAIFVVAAVAFFAAPGITAGDTDKFRLDPNTYRIAENVGYIFWISAVMIGALLLWATSAIALRTAILPRWFAWVGVVAGILQLFAVFFIPAFIYWGWILVASGLLTWRRAAAPAVAPPAV